MKSFQKVHEFNSRKEWRDYVWQKLTESFSEAGSGDKVAKSLGMLVTASEKKQIINRAVAISLLREGKTYKEIGELLWLSPQTISAIAKSTRTGSGYTSRYARHKAGSDAKKHSSKGFKVEFKMLIDATFDALFTLPPPPRQGRRIPPGGVRVIKPHGKLVYPRRIRL